jgi:hypothetical protein
VVDPGQLRHRIRTVVDRNTILQLEKNPPAICAGASGRLAFLDLKCSDPTRKSPRLRPMYCEIKDFQARRRAATMGRELFRRA